MDLLRNNYESSSDSEADDKNKSDNKSDRSDAIKMSININPSPNVMISLADKQKQKGLVDANKQMIGYNPTVTQLYTPVQGPQHPTKTGHNAWLGNVQREHMDESTFNEQYHTYVAYGYARNPSQQV